MSRLRQLLSLATALLGLAAPARAAAPADAAPAPGAAAGNPAAEAVLADLAAQLSAHFHLAGELQLEALRPLPLADLPPGAPARLVVTEFTSAPASSMLVRCRLEAGGAPLPSVTVTLRALLWADVWVAREPLAAGQPFDAALLDVRRCDLFRERDALPATAGDRDFVFARAVPAGRTLAWRDLARRPLVRRGEIVEVCASDGALTVTLKALATQNGGRGETVLVRNLESRKEFPAIVVDDDRVQVRF